MKKAKPRRAPATPKVRPAADVYSIEAVVQITQTPRRRIAVYCRRGLLAPLAPPAGEGWQFDDESIRTLRRLEYLRSEYGLNLSGAGMISALLGELEQLRQEVRFLRGR